MLSIRHSIIFVLSVMLSGFFLYGSFAFGGPTLVTDTGSVVDIKISNIDLITTTGSSTKKMVYTPYDPSSSTGRVDPKGILFYEFGRLTTAFLMSSPTPSIAFSGTNALQFDASIRGIFSFYNPFVEYSLTPKNHSFDIRQITNGSFYIANEPDGTISVYSIDIVAQLTFFDTGIEMTNMILFPGMYIRFDPAANKSLKGADLYRIKLVLDDTNTTQNKTTGLEFINPRVKQGTNSNDVFIVYKFPRESELFQMLHLLFRERIAQVDLIKNYESNPVLTDSTEVSLIKNPAKINYYLLDSLNAILAKTVRSSMDPAQFRTKIKEIHTQSEQLVAGNDVQKTLEQFLTDARFAIFGNITNKQFDLIYNETADILGIVKNTGKGQFFQYLSDMYSRNIISQRQDPTVVSIDTYTPTAKGLADTLVNKNITSKDYFDIALYSYLILEKVQDSLMFTEDALRSSATFSFIQTIFIASEKYVAGLPSSVSQKSAYQTLVTQFYAPIINTLVRSLYSVYTIQESGHIFLNPQYLDGDTVKVPSDLKKNLISVSQIAQATYERVLPIYDNNDDSYALGLFHDSLMRLRGFIDMIENEAYVSYQARPYITEDLGTTFLPRISTNQDGSILERPDHDLDRIKNTTKNKNVSGTGGAATGTGVNTINNTSAPVPSTNDSSSEK